MRKTLALIAMFSLFLAACGGGDGSGGDPAENDWAFDSGSLNGEAIPFVDGHPITLIFDVAESSIGGQAACNQYFGGYTISGSEISFSEMGQTMMACLPEEVMESESQYLAAMAAVTNFSIDGDRLTLTGDDVEIVFVVDEGA
jgi:heat shock protein HslJ